MLRSRQHTLTLRAHYGTYTMMPNTDTPGEFLRGITLLEIHECHTKEQRLWDVHSCVGRVSTVTTQDTPRTEDTTHNTHTHTETTPVMIFLSAK